MAGKARNPSIDEKIRHLEELVRRLGTRLPQQASAVEAWQSLDGHLATGWLTGAFEEEARYYVDRDRVCLAGIIYYVGGGNNLVPFDSMPAECIPALEGLVVLHTDITGTISGTEHLWWQSAIMVSTGQWLIGPHLDYPAGPPDLTYFMLDPISYRVG